MSDNDDLDALLDEAMDIVDEQERKHEEEVKEQEAKLDADLQKALDEQNGLGGDALGGDMIKMFQSLLGSSGAPGLDGDVNFDSFKDDLAKLVSTLEDVEGLGDQDKANLTRVKELMTVLDTNDEAKAQELLGEIQRDPAAGMPESDMKPEDVEAAFKEAVESLQKLSETDVAQGLAAGAGAPAASASPAGDAAPENIANLLLGAILDPDFVKPIMVMRDAYGPYLAAKDATLSDDEKTLYKKQHAKTVEICEFLAVPVASEDEARVTQLLELMHQFSELGEPPKDLPEYAPKKTADGEETS